MKAKHIFSLAIAALVGFASCSKDGGVAPVALNPASIYAEAVEGQVILHWDIPSNADYKYVQVNYTLPENEYNKEPKECLRTASIYADQMVIDGLLARYGAIDYTICTVSEDGTPSAATHISAQCLPVQPSYAYSPQGPVALSKSGIWANKGEYYEGPITDLVDGNTSTYFHSTYTGYIKVFDGESWDNWWDVADLGCPIYIVVKLPKAINAFSFSIVNRNNANRSNPETVEVYVSNEFSDGLGDYENSYDELFDEAKYNARYLGTVSGMPDGQGASYTSPVFADVNETFTYVWLKTTNITNGKNYIAVSTLDIIEQEVFVDDPEAE